MMTLLFAIKDMIWRPLCFQNNDKIANLIGKLNFYKLIPYPMDKCLSGRRGPARQTSEKDVLCLHRPSRSSAVHSPGGV